MLGQDEIERHSFSMPCNACKTWVKGWRHYTLVQGQFFCDECVRYQLSALSSSSAPSGDSASEFMSPGTDAGHLKAGQDAAERVKVPRCWDLFGAYDIWARGLLYHSLCSGGVPWGHERASRWGDSQSAGRA